MGRLSLAPRLEPSTASPEALELARMKPSGACRNEAHVSRESRARIPALMGAVLAGLVGNFWAPSLADAQEPSVPRPHVQAAFDREALPSDVFFRGPEGATVPGVRCGIQPLDPLEASLMEAQLRRWRREQARAGGARAMSQAPINVDVAFHVVHDGPAGNVPESRLDQQIVVLNAAFSGAGFRFTKSSVSRTNNPSWFTGCAGGQESAMKSTLNVDPTRTLNIYTCEPSGGVLGYAYLPSSLPSGDHRDGVVLLHSSLPGGSAAPYNLGDTGTHEVGHYLGLYHTFDPAPNGCQAPGDRVADTPDEREPQFGCPPLGSVDSCPSAGVDPVTNFMDYVDDACMDTFTSLQATRMRDLTAVYRPDLDSGGVTPPVAPTDITAQVTSGTSIRLTWTDNADNETEHLIYRRSRPTGGAIAPWILRATLGADVTLYNDDSGVNTAANQYQYSVVPRNSAGAASRLSNWTAPNITPPEAPTNIVARATSATSTLLTWTDNAGNEVEQIIYRRSRTGGTIGAWSLAATLSSNVTSYVDSSVTTATHQYQYSVVPRNTAGAASRLSNWTPITMTPPAAPTGIVARATSASSIELTWNDNASNEAEQIIYKRSRSGGTVGAWALATTLPANTVSFIDSTGVNTATHQYQYSVVPRNSAGAVSRLSNWTPLTTTPPAAPTDITALATSASRVELTWTDNASNEVEQIIYRRARNGGTVGAWTLAATLPANATSFSDTTVSTTTHGYQYSVVPRNAAGAVSRISNWTGP